MCSTLADDGSTPWEILFGRTLTYVMVFLPCVYSSAGSWATGLRRTDARKHVQPSARSIAVSHLRLIDRYIVRSHLQFDATDDDAPAVHYLVADTDVGRFCAGRSSTGLGAPAGCFNPLGHWVVIIRGVMLKGVASRHSCHITCRCSAWAQPCSS